MNKKTEQKTALRRYHHGDLRDALVSVSRRLISECGLGRFKIADACRCLGVSTAAPYRHFPDRDALLDAVCVQAFNDLGAELRAARASSPRGSVESLIALGRSYLDFVTRDPELFELMWGSMRETPAPAELAAAHETGIACFQVLIEAVEDVRETQGLQSVATVDIAIPLWSFVQGLASLKMRDKLEIVENADPDRTIDLTVRAIIEGFRGQADRCERCE